MAEESNSNFIPRTPLGVLKEQEPATAETLNHLVDSIREGLAGNLLNMDAQGRDRLLEATRNLDAGLFIRGMDRHLKNPNLVITALEGASALLEPEPTHKEEAQIMVDSLRKSFGV